MIQRCYQESNRKHFGGLKKCNWETDLACSSTIISEEKKSMACLSILFDFGRAGRWKL